MSTTLNGAILSTDVSLAVVSASGYPAAPFVIVVDPDQAGEELILVGAKAGTTFSSLTRGVDGTSAAGHASGVTVKHVISATDIDEANSHRWSSPATANDTDASVSAIHHTIGVTAVTAAPGNHTHAGGSAGTTTTDVQLIQDTTSTTIPFNSETTTATITVTLPSGWTSMSIAVVGIIHVQSTGSTSPWRGNMKVKLNGTAYGTAANFSASDEAFSTKYVTVGAVTGGTGYTADVTLTTTGNRQDSVAGLTSTQTGFDAVVIKTRTG